MPIVLMGLRGSGKTSAGKLLAEALWQPFIDTDDRVAFRAGKSVADIFAEDGEAAFRTLEAEVAAEALREKDAVIALGGGAVLSPSTAQLLHQSKASRIYLKCDPAVCARRCEADHCSPSARPRLTTASNLAEEMAELQTEREALFRDLATAELDTTHLTPQETAERLAKMV